ncbi:MAG: histidinol-phosphate transaminase [Candidatus Acidiferrales bacterium]
MLKARAALDTLKEYHPPLSGRDGLRLDFNENTIGCSPRVLRKLASITADELSRYPQREPAERIVADFLQMSAAQTLLTNGVDEGIHLLCLAFLDPGDEALVAVPTFGMYEIFAQQTGARVLSIPGGPDFSFPIDQLIAAVQPKTRLIMLANPNNPTGGVAEIAEIERILEAAPDSAVLVDEAYFDFYGKSVLPLVSRYQNLFVTRTFSKAYGLAGMRAGVLCGNAEQMRLVRKVCSPYNVNQLALACLPEALSDAEFVRAYVAEVLEGRSRLQDELRCVGLPFWPSHANFVLMRIGQNSNAFVRAMKARGILVRDRTKDPGCAGCVRVTLGTLAQTAQLLPALRICLAEVGWPNASQEVRA